MSARLAQLRHASLPVRVLVLGLAVVVCAMAVAPLAGLLGGWMGVGAAVAAAGLCAAGAIVALSASHWLRGPKYALHALLAGMAARMGIPLGSALACHWLGGPLADAGLLYYLLVFYPVTLGAETYLSLPAVPLPNPAPRATKDGIS